MHSSKCNVIGDNRSVSHAEFREGNRGGSTASLVAAVCGQRSHSGSNRQRALFSPLPRKVVTVGGRHDLSGEHTKLRGRGDAHCGGGQCHAPTRMTVKSSLSWCSVHRAGPEHALLTRASSSPWRKLFCQNCFNLGWRRNTSGGAEGAQNRGEARQGRKTLAVSQNVTRVRRRDSAPMPSAALRTGGQCQGRVPACRSGPLLT